MATEISKSNFNDRKLRIDDDFRRDQMVVKGILDAAKIEAQFMSSEVSPEDVEAQNTPESTSGPSPLPLPGFAQQLMDQAYADRAQPGAPSTQPIGG